MLYKLIFPRNIKNVKLLNSHHEASTTDFKTLQRWRMKGNHGSKRLTSIQNKMLGDQIQQYIKRIMYQKESRVC